jgi:hypothetical protein
VPGGADRPNRIGLYLSLTALVGAVGLAGLVLHRQQRLVLSGGGGGAGGWMWSWLQVVLGPRRDL